MVYVQVKGLKRVNNMLNNLPKELDRQISMDNENFMSDVVKSAKWYAPKDTGVLKESIRKEKTKVKGKKKQWKVISDAPWAAFQELGFKTHTFYANPSNGFNSSKLAPNRRYTVSKNTSFLAPAVEHNLSKYLQKLNGAVHTAIGKSGR